jgi:hypothetical protein
MANQAGSLPIPVPPSSNGAPLEDGLLREFSAVISRECQTAYDNVSGCEPVIRQTFSRNPELGDFHPNDLPALYVWAATTGSRRAASGIHIRERSLNMAWIPAPARDSLLQEKWPFWSAVDAAVRFAVDVETYSLDSVEGVWGVNLVDKLGLYKLDVGPGQSIEARIEGNQSVEVVDMVLWTIEAQEELTPDPALPPAVPTAREVNITTGGETPLTVIQSIKDPV